MHEIKISRLTLNVPLMLCGIGGKYYDTSKHPDLQITLVASSYIRIDRHDYDSQCIPLNDVRQFTPHPPPLARTAPHLTTADTPMPSPPPGAAAIKKKPKRTRKATTTSTTRKTTPKKTKAKKQVA